MLAAVRRRRRRLLPLPRGTLSAALSSSTATATSAADPTAVSYLISRCGLSPAAAALAAPLSRLTFPGDAARADAVLALLRRYGFSDAEVSATLRQLPVLLAADPVKTLQPKLDFLSSVGISGALLPRLISVSPILLRRSLQGHLVPFFATLRDALGGSDARVVSLFSKSPYVARCLPKATLIGLLHLLRDVYGMSSVDIAKLIELQPAVILQKPDRVNEVVEVGRRFGVEPGNPMFVHVFAMIAQMKPHTLESKMALYRRLGFSKESIALIIRRYPTSMCTSEKKIQEMVSFLTSKAGLSLEDIVCYPTMMVRSLEVLSRRCAVLAELRRAGKQLGRLPKALLCTPECFLQRYVLPHANELPDVLQAIEGEIPFKGFHESEKKPKQKTMST